MGNLTGLLMSMETAKDNFAKNMKTRKTKPMCNKSKKY